MAKWQFMRKRQSLWLTGIIVLGLLGRMVITFGTGLERITNDTKYYFRQADAIIAGKYINFFPNGYPFIIALVKSTIAGLYVNDALLLINIGMSTCAIYFTYHIAKLTFKDEGIALLAAFIVAIFPNQLNYVRWLLSEVPSLFFLIGSYYFLFRGKDWLSGLFLGFAIIVRSNLLLVMVFLVLLYLIINKRVPIGLIIGACIPILATAFYCRAKTGEFSIAGNNIVNIVTAVTAYGNNVDFHFKMEEKYPDITTSGKAVAMYMDHMRQDPVYFIKQRLANAWTLWSFYAPAAAQRGVVSRIILGLGNLFLVGFGLFGWWSNRRNFFTNLLILPFLGVTIIHVLLFAQPRYTFPVEPFMIILASWTIFWIFRRVKSIRKANGGPL